MTSVHCLKTRTTLNIFPTHFCGTAFTQQWEQAKPWIHGYIGLVSSDKRTNWCSCTLGFKKCFFSTGLTPFIWRHLLPVSLTLWQFMTDRTLCHPCWGNSVAQCSHPISVPPQISYSLSSAQITQWMGLVGELLTVKRSVGGNDCVFFLILRTSERHLFIKLCTCTTQLMISWDIQSLELI